MNLKLFRFFKFYPIVYAFLFLNFLSVVSCNGINPTSFLSGWNSNSGIEKEEFFGNDSASSPEVDTHYSPTAGTGNGGGYSGLVYVSIDINVECYSEELGRMTNITSILEILPNGQYVEYEGCDRNHPMSSPIVISRSEILNVWANGSFQGVIGKKRNYELLENVLKQDQFSPIRRVCYLTRDSWIYSDSDPFSKGYQAGDLIDLLLVIREDMDGDGLYKIEISYSKSDKNGNPESYDIPPFLADREAPQRGSFDLKYSSDKYGFSLTRNSVIKENERLNMIIEGSPQRFYVRNCIGND